MHEHSLPEKLLPSPLPADSLQRVLLVCARRMAAHGLRDAHAAQMMLGAFGLHFRRPLVLMRAFMLELAQSSGRTITLAPCCATRMTKDEGRILAALQAAASDTAQCARHLRTLSAGEEISGPLSVAVALADTLADLGRPLLP